MDERKARGAVEKAKGLKVKFATIGDVQEYSEAIGYLARVDGPEEREMRDEIAILKETAVSAVAHFCRCGKPCSDQVIDMMRIDLDGAKSQLAAKDARIAELEALNLRAKDVLKRTLDCEAADWLARNCLEIELAVEQEAGERLCQALEMAKDIPEINPENYDEDEVINMSNVAMAVVVQQFKALAAYKSSRVATLGEDEK